MLLICKIQKLLKEASSCIYHIVLITQQKNKKKTTKKAPNYGGYNFTYLELHICLNIDLIWLPTWKFWNRHAMGFGLLAGPGIGGWPWKPCMFWYPWRRCCCCWFEGNIWLLFNSDWRWLSWWLFKVVFIDDMSPVIQTQGNRSQHSFQQSGGIFLDSNFNWLLSKCLCKTTLFPFNLLRNGPQGMCLLIFVPFFLQHCFFCMSHLSGLFLKVSDVTVSAFGTVHSQVWQNELPSYPCLGILLLVSKEWLLQTVLGWWGGRRREREKEKII